jgi:DNA-binding transcriptional regulator YhcF (GntR family)
MVVPDSIKIIPNRSATASGPGSVTYDLDQLYLPYRMDSAFGRAAPGGVRVAGKQSFVLTGNHARVRPMKMSDQVAGQIRRMIARGELVDGDWLPPEAELIERFGVSRPTLREAFRLLEGDSLVTIRRGPPEVHAMKSARRYVAETQKQDRVIDLLYWRCCDRVPADSLRQRDIRARQSNRGSARPNTTPMRSAVHEQQVCVMRGRLFASVEQLQHGAPQVRRTRVPLRVNNLPISDR